MAAKSKRGPSLWWFPAIAGVAGLAALGALSQSYAEYDGREAKQMGAIQLDESVESATALAKLDGHWLYADGDRGRDRVRAAIDSATKDMDPVSRELARDRLREILVPDKDHDLRIDLHPDADTLDLRFDDCQALDNVALGSWVDWRCDGRSFRAKHSLDGEALVQHQQAKIGELDIYRRFKITDDRLTMGFSLDHGQIPKSVKFALHYRRDPSE